jgi:hypothetical protein
VEAMTGLMQVLPHDRSPGIESVVQKKRGFTAARNLVTGAVGSALPFLLRFRSDR